MTALTFEFTQYRSPKLAHMLDLARRGGQFLEWTVGEGPGGLKMYETTFEVSQSSIKAAVDVALCLMAHPSVDVVANGQRINIHRVAGILQCYAQSFQPSDWRAHCWQARPARFFEDELTRGAISYPVSIGLGCGTATTIGYDDGYAKKLTDHPIWLFPCRYANCAPVVNELSLQHPSSLRAQVEQALTHYECHWCPRLQNLDEWDLLQWGSPTDGTQGR